MFKFVIDVYSKGEVFDVVNVEFVYLCDKVMWKKLLGRE